MKFLYRILKILPMPVLQTLFDFVAIILYLLLKKRRIMAQDNIKKAIGGNYKKTALKTYLYFAKMVAENIKYIGNEKYIKKHAKIEGEEYYDYAKSLNRGVIAVLAHFGNWEMMACVASFLKEKVNIMVRPLDNKKLDEIIEGARASCASRVISSRESAFRFIKLLKKNETLGILIDQAANENALKIDFFNRKARVNEGVAIFSYRLGTPVLPAYMKEDKGKYTLVFEKPIVCEHTGDFKKDVENMMIKIYSRFEDWIRHSPEKYLWMHNRWK